MYNIFRLKIKDEMHKYWRNNLIGTEPTNDGKSRIEIDES